MPRATTTTESYSQEFLNSLPKELVKEGHPGLEATNRAFKEVESAKNACHGSKKAKRKALELAQKRIDEAEAEKKRLDAETDQNVEKATAKYNEKQKVFADRLYALCTGVQETVLPAKRQKLEDEAKAVDAMEEWAEKMKREAEAFVTDKEHTDTERDSDPETSENTALVITTRTGSGPGGKPANYLQLSANQDAEQEEEQEQEQEHVAATEKYKKKGEDKARAYEIINTHGNLGTMASWFLAIKNDDSTVKRTHFKGIFELNKNPREHEGNPANVDQYTLHKNCDPNASSEPLRELVARGSWFHAFLVLHQHDLDEAR